MITFVDSHCHLNMLNIPIAEAVANARMANITHMLCVATSLENIPQVIKIAEDFDLHASVGIHPSDVHENSFTLETLQTFAQHPKVVAIGETGLDYYRTEDDSVMAQQQASFRLHIALSKALKKPLIIHTRQAQADTLRILQEENAGDIGGVLHCFTEDLAMAEAAIAMGFYISFSGIVTFKNAESLQDVARKIPMEKMLIETDAPFLAPVPFRGKFNQPAYVRYVAEKIAELRDISVESVAEITAKNYARLFLHTY